MTTSHANDFINSVKKFMESEKKEIIDITCKLISAKTENPPGDEILAVRIVEDFFQSLQIPYKIFEKTKNRANIVGYIG
ncbi:MAG: dapE, partial [Candidatus Brocadiaceae bacterium]|nr:dapE [Candidatus Brocadiaceae bacterium]